VEELKGYLEVLYGYASKIDVSGFKQFASENVQIFGEEFLGNLQASPDSLCETVFHIINMVRREAKRSLQ